MASQLEEMIAPTRLRLLGVRTLPVAPLTLKAGDGASPPADRSDALPTALYKHGIEIKVEGSYEDLVAYVERLEQAKLKLLWSSVLLSADAHPKLLLTLTVYTLSLEKTWLIV
jgi:MSHA biogenesis protein MshJ